MKAESLRVRYFLHCLRHRNGYEHAKFLKKHNAFYSMGENCYFQPYNLPADAKYIRMANNVVVGSHVTFACHDGIHRMLNNTSDSWGQYKRYWGIIDIKDNVFIGTNVTILAGVTIGSDVVIAAGSLVNKDVPDGKIVAGVPAKIVGEVSDLAKTRKQYSLSPISQMNSKDRIQYLWNEQDKKTNIDV